MEKVDSAVASVVQLLETLSPTDWTEAQFESFLTRIGDQCGQYVLARQKARAGKKRTREGSSSDAAHHDAAATEHDDDDDEVTERQAMEEVAAALERVRQHIVKKYPYGSLDEPTRRPYQHDISLTTSAATAPRDAPTEAPVYAIDAYLYPEEAIDALVASGQVSREYCRRCGSTDIELADFITHSFSMEQLLYISTCLLPRLPTVMAEAGQSGASSTATVVDVGSRLGVVLWSCYFSARAGLLQHVRRVVGVELSARYCAVQRELGKRFCARPLQVGSADGGAPLQLNVVESSCFEENGAQALAAADVIILHNVFEYFCHSPKEHLECWKRLRDTVAKHHGQLWITSPSLEETFTAFSDEDVRAVLTAGGAGDSSRTPTTTDAATWETWVKAFLEPVDVTSLAGEFVATWAGQAAEGVDHPDAHAHGGCGCGESDCASETSHEAEEDASLTELKELVGNIHVYRVR